MTLNLIVGGVKVLKPNGQNIYCYGIGSKNTLPWGHIKTDMSLFRKYTMGKIDMSNTYCLYDKSQYNNELNNMCINPINQTLVIMGRKTWESIPGKSLKNRDNLVLTRNHDISSLYEKICCSKKNSTFFMDITNKDIPITYFKNLYKQIWIIGGSSIYDLFISKYSNMIDNIILNEIILHDDKKDDNVISFDSFFPQIATTQFNLYQTKQFNIDKKENELVDKIVLHHWKLKREP